MASGPFPGAPGRRQAHRGPGSPHRPRHWGSDPFSGLRPVSWPLTSGAAALVRAPSLSTCPFGDGVFTDFARLLTGCLLQVRLEGPLRVRTPVPAVRALHVLCPHGQLSLESRHGSSAAQALVIGGGEVARPVLARVVLWGRGRSPVWPETPTGVQVTWYEGCPGRALPRACSRQGTMAGQPSGIQTVPPRWTHLLRKDKKCLKVLTLDKGCSERSLSGCRGCVGHTSSRACVRVDGWVPGTPRGFTFMVHV